jgi:membrane associated rhomboid family serine protease
MNMFFVYQISNIFETVYETKKEQILVYFFSSIPINLLSFSYMYFANVENTMVGYSGVCFALIGALWFALDKKAKKSFSIQILLFHAVVIYLGVSIAWYAHLSGFIVGLLISKILKKTW